MRSHLHGGLALLLAACGGGSGGGSDAGASDVAPPTSGEATCAEGFRPLADGAGCEPTLPTTSCAPGSGPRIGATSCLPVGVTACPVGFVKHGSGWGCDVVVAPAACPSGSRERIGSATCTPVTACNEAFPPPGATIFVNTGYGPGELDASHFRTLTAALAAAAPGAVIAVEAGTYPEKLTPTRPVTIIGRCAEQVVLATNDDTGPGLRVENLDVVAKNLTLRGFVGGAAVASGKLELSGVVVEASVITGVAAIDAGAHLRLTNVVVTGTRTSRTNNQAFGVLAQKGAVVEIEDSVVAGSEFANVVATGAGASVTLTRAIVRDGKPPATGTLAGSFGLGVFASNGGQAVLAECAILDNAANGVLVAQGSASGAPASGSLARSVVRGTALDVLRAIGRGVEVGRASRLSVTQSTISGSDQADVLCTEGGTLEIHDSTTFGAASDDASVRGGAGLAVTDNGKAEARSLAVISPRNFGVRLQDGGELTMADSLVLDARPLPERDARDTESGAGIAVQRSSRLTMTRSAVQDAHTVGLVAAFGSTATLEGSLVRRTVGSTRGHLGRGMSVQDGAKLEVVRSAVLDNRELGIMVIDAETSLTLRDSTVGGTRFDHAGRFGIGMFLAGGAHARIENSTLTGSEGIGLAAAAAGGEVRRSFISRNAVGVHVQEGASLVESDAPSGNPLELTFSSDTRLVGNATRVGSGNVPLPPVLTSGK